MVFQIPKLDGNIYNWDNGTLRFDSNTTVTTSWGKGTCKWLDELTVEVSWLGYHHLIKMNSTYDSYESICKSNNRIVIGSLLKEFDNRNTMIKYYCNKLSNPKILEIGIFKGEFFNFIFNNCNIGSIDGVDLFEGINNSGDVDGNNDIQYDVGKSYLELTKKYKDIHNVSFHKSDSSTYLKSIDDNFYDLIYIDGDHSYHGVKLDLNNAFNKIKNGGYIMGHDYEMNMDRAKHYYNFGVKKAVDEFCSVYNQQILAKAMDGCVSYCIQITK